MAAHGSSEAREAAPALVLAGPVALLSAAPSVCDRPVAVGRFRRAFWAVRGERLRDAAVDLGAMLDPFADLPPTLREARADGPLPEPPLDLHDRSGPWDLVRDRRRPVVGDAVLLACQMLYRVTAFEEVVDWIDQVRCRGLTWPDEIQPDLIRAAVLVCEGRLREGKLLMEDLLRDHPAMPSARRAHLLHNLGVTSSQLGEFRRGRECLQQAGTISREIGLEWSLGAWLVAHGLVETRSFRLTEGEALIREAVERLDATGQRRYANNARFNLAIALYKQARLPEALELVDRIEAPLLADGAHLGWLQARLVRCKISNIAGRPDEATAIAEVVERECTERGLGREKGLSVEMQGDAALQRGEFAHARALYRRAMMMARREAPEGDLAAGLRRRLAEVDLRSGDVDVAQRGLREALLSSRSAGEAFEEVVSGRLLAEAELALGNVTRARAVANCSVARGRVHGCELEMARALLVEGRAVAALTDRGAAAARRETAWASAAEARRVFERLGFDADCAVCDAFLAELREAWRTAWIWAGGPPPPESLTGDAAPAFVAGSPPMVACAEIMAAAAASDDAVLITGETGTGKEVAARRIHDLGRRRGGPLVAVNCAAIPADLFEREMFGHAAGAFTGAGGGARGLVEQAHRGTLFLDEVGDLPAALQPRLLRLLQEGTYRRLGDPVERQVDLRVISATNVDLPRRVATGAFRRDLYFRLCGLELGLPPLRDRGADVLDLVKAFARRGLGGDAEPADVLSDLVLAALERYDWPGNVRELEAVVRRACLFVRTGKPLVVGMLPVGLQGVVRGMEGGGSGLGGAVSNSRVGAVGLRLDDRLAAAETEAIGEALAVCGGNRTRAAEVLGISRKALYAKMGRLGMG